MTTSIYETIVEGSNDGIFVAQDGEVVYANDRLRELTGYDRDELVGASKTSFVADEDTDLVESYHFARMEGESAPNQYEVELETRDGERVPVELSVRRGEYEGEPASISVCREISDRLERQRELKSRRQRMQELFDAAPDGIVIHDEAGEVLDVNDRICENLGYTHAELTDMNVADFEGSVTEATLRERLGEMAVGEMEKLVGEHERADGTTFPVEVWISKVEGPEGLRYLSFSRDITDRKQRERELRRKTRALEKAPVGVVLTDPSQEDNPLIYVNEQFVETTGYEKEEVIGRNCRFLQGEGTAPESVASMSTAIDGAEPVEETLRNYRKDGTEFWNRVTIAPVRNDDGDIENFVGFQRDITERKRQERRIRELKERLELAVEGANLGVWDWDVTADEVEYNDQWASMLGHSPAEIDPTPAARTRRIHPEDRDDVEETLAAHLSEAASEYDTEYRIEAADGDWIWVRDVGRVVERDEAGEPERFIAVARDVTERKESERAIERAREELRQVIDLVPDLVFVKNREGEFLLANEATAEAFGLTPAELEGTLESEVIPEVDESEEFRADDIEVIESGEAMYIPEEELTTADGETRILQTTKLPYEVAGTGEQAVLGYARDVTDLKEYERELATERDFFNSVIEGLPFPFYVLDVEDYTIEYANSEAQVNTGETCHELTHDRDEPCDVGEDPVHCPVSEVVESGEPVTVEHAHVTEDGSERVFQVHAAPIYDEEGTLVQMAESNIDVTDRVRYEQRLEGQRDNLEVLNQVVRHDIRNDLQLVVAYADILQRYVDEEGREYVEQVQDAASDAVDITETARDVTEIMLQSDVDRVPKRLRSILEEEVEDVSAGHERAVVTVEGRLPDVNVRADDMLDSVFRNLLTNAILHNDKEVPKVAVSATADERTVEVRVADNGPGISEERKEDIFQEGEMGLESEGTGLGLYLVDTLVDRYGGDVRIEDTAAGESGTGQSTPGSSSTGAVFVVELPIAD